MLEIIKKSQSKDDKESTTLLAELGCYLKVPDSEEEKITLGSGQSLQGWLNYLVQQRTEP
jgi:hypothetical protein